MPQSYVEIQVVTENKTYDNLRNQVHACENINNFLI